MLDEELKMLNDFCSENKEKLKITSFQCNYRPKFRVDGKCIEPQIDAIFETEDEKTYLVEAYSTYAWKSGNWKDYQDRKVRNDALKLLANIKLHKDENKDVIGVILLHYTTYKNFKNSNRYTFPYLKTLGIEVKSVLSSTAVAALSRKKDLGEMIEYHQKQNEKILEEILGYPNDEEEVSKDIIDKSEEYANLLQELKEDLYG